MTGFECDGNSSTPAYALRYEYYENDDEGRLSRVIGGSVEHAARQTRQEDRLAAVRSSP